MVHRIETLIVGAGPAGLAVAGRLRHLSLPFHIIDGSPEGTSSWNQHYDRVHLHTVKRFSHLPYMPFPASYPQYVPRDLFVTYLQDYARTFEIQPSWDTRATSVRKEGNAWMVATSSKVVYVAQQVVICTGVNREPVHPEWPGLPAFPGKVVHSRGYRNPTPFQNQRVLVVGMGNTGAEIALDLWEHGIEVALSVRGPVNIVRRDTFGRPVQETSILLGKLPSWVSNPIGRWLSKMTVGDLSPYGLMRPEMAPAEQLRLTGKTPVIDVGTIDQIKQGNIMVFPGIKDLEETLVCFSDGRRQAFDVLILATGYRPSLEDIVEDVTPALDERGVPKALWAEDLPGLYFLGFGVYGTGILHHIQRDSAKIAEDIQQLTS